jgi:hypothetical protein
MSNLVKAISTTCTPSYPDRNLPTIFVYHEGGIKAQFIGPLVFGGMNLTRGKLGWKLSETGAINMDLEENPNKPKTSCCPWCGTVCVVLGTHELYLEPLHQHFFVMGVFEIGS